jgi:predicted nucleotidyltransferase
MDNYGARANEVAAALFERPGGMRLAEIASAAEAPLSSAQRAVSSLVASGLVAAVGQPALYELNLGHPAGQSFVEFSIRVLPIERALDIVLRSNPSVEYAGRDCDGYLAVLSPFAEVSDIAKLDRTIGLIKADRLDAPDIQIVERSDLHDALMDDDNLRSRGASLTTVKGSQARAFRDPHRHGTLNGQALGGLHPSLPKLPRDAVRQIANDFGLDTIAAFGSAVRSDFRPDSDVDVMIKTIPGRPMRIETLMGVQRRFEELLDRDVDVINIQAIDPVIAAHAKDDEVYLYG